MAIKRFKRFLKGIVLRGESSNPNEQVEGSLYHNSTTSELGTFLDGQDRIIITNDQTQTLENKTIDADQNMISNIRNDEIAFDAEIDATKIADGSVDNNEFQALDGVTSNIQTQIDSKASQVDLDAHINNPTDAHEASAIEYDNSVTGLTATEVQAAIDELYSMSGAAVDSVNGKTGVVTLDSDDIPEGSTNLYFTDGRAQTAAVIDDMSGSETNQAPSVASIKTYISSVEGANKTLSNLTSPTAINQDLVPNTNNTRTVGSFSNRFNTMYASSFHGTLTIRNSSYAEIGNLNYSQGIPSGNPSAIRLITNQNSGNLPNNNSLAVVTEGTTSNTSSAAIRLETGNVVDGTSGSIFLRPGIPSGSGVRGVVDVTGALISNVLDPVSDQDAATKKYVDDNAGSTLEVQENGSTKVATATILNFLSGATIVEGASGEAEITITGSGGANTSLSNLSSVAINSSLIPGAGANNVDLGGDSGYHFKNAWIQDVNSTNIRLRSATWGQIGRLGGVITPQGNGVGLTNEGNNYPIGIYTSDISISGESRNIYIGTGDTTNGNTGDIILEVGTPTLTGTRGKINLSAISVNLPQNSSDPSTGVAGDIYYNTTTNVIRFYNGTAWSDI